jgi:hypothetical protein
MTRSSRPSCLAARNGMRHRRAGASHLAPLSRTCWRNCVSLKPTRTPTMRSALRFLVSASTQSTISSTVVAAVGCAAVAHAHERVAVTPRQFDGAGLLGPEFLQHPHSFAFDRRHDGSPPQFFVDRPRLVVAAAAKR